MGWLSGPFWNKKEREVVVEFGVKGLFFADERNEMVVRKKWAVMELGWLDAMAFSFTPHHIQI